MFKLPQKVRKCVEMFVTWGGLSGFVSSIINGEITQALITAVIFGTLVICYQYFNNKFRD